MSIAEWILTSTAIGAVVVTLVLLWLTRNMI